MSGEFVQPNRQAIDELGHPYNGNPDSLNDIHHKKIEGAQVPLRHLVNVEAGIPQPQEIK